MLSKMSLKILILSIGFMLSVAALGQAPNSINELEPIVNWIHQTHQKIVSSGQQEEKTKLMRELKDGLTKLSAQAQSHYFGIKDPEQKDKFEKEIYDVILDYEQTFLPLFLQAFSNPPKDSKTALILSDECNYIFHRLELDYYSHQGGASTCSTVSPTEKMVFEVLASYGCNFSEPCKGKKIEPKSLKSK